MAVQEPSRIPPFLACSGSGSKDDARLIVTQASRRREWRLWCCCNLSSGRGSMLTCATPKKAATARRCQPKGSMTPRFPFQTCRSSTGVGAHLPQPQPVLGTIQIAATGRRNIFWGGAGRPLPASRRCLPSDMPHLPFKANQDENWLFDMLFYLNFFIWSVRPSIVLMKSLWQNNYMFEGTGTDVRRFLKPHGL